MARSGPYERGSDDLVGPQSRMGSPSLGTVEVDAAVAPDKVAILTSEGRVTSLPPSKMRR